MANYSVDRKQFGIKKESARGTAEATAARWLMVTRDSAVDYSLEHIDNENIANTVAGQFAPEAGRKIVTGNMTIDLEAQTIGEMMMGLFGTVASSAVETTSLAHTFTKTTSIQHPGMTVFVDRGVQAYKYNLATPKSIELSGDSLGKCIAAIELLGKSETTTAALSPTIPTPDPLTFYQADVKIDTVSAGARIGKWNLKIDNQAEAVWWLNQSQDCGDIVVAKPMSIEGGMDMFFTSTSERNDFLANTSRKLEFILTGDLIEGTTYNKIAITLYNCKYTAVPWDGELDGGLLGASLAFKAFYSVSDSKAIDVIVTNIVASY